MKTTDSIFQIPFVKMSAAGNDFVLIDEKRLSLHEPDFEVLARKLCNRNYGVGADGLLVYKSHTVQSFEMDYYNADGSTGGMCGNGARCIAAYYFDSYGKEKSTVEFMAFGYLYKALKTGLKLSVHMRDPSHMITDLTIDIDGNEIDCNFIDTGAPHVVIFFDDLRKKIPDIDFEKFDIQQLGRSIRRHEAFRPLGTNVNFVCLLKDDTIQMRTYERGVEGETLACGTGAIASAIVNTLHTKNKPPVRVQTRSGEILEVMFTNDDNYKNFSDITLSGTWRYHFTGIAYVNTQKNDSNGIAHIPDLHMQTMQSLSTKMDQ